MCSPETFGTLHTRQAIDKGKYKKLKNVIETEYSDAHGYFGGFYKLVGTGETDSRLDEGINVLKGMKDVLIQILNKKDETTHEIKETNRNLGSKMDQMLDKKDQMLGKQDESISEIKEMNRSLNNKIEKVLDKSDILELKGDVANMKSALRAKGII